MTTETIPETALSIWSIDASHSSIHFKVRHMGISWVRGEFRAHAGTLHLKQENLAASRIEVDIDVASISTSDEQRDQHLRSADFFDVARYPLMNFQSTGIVKGSANTAVISGALTIHGITRPVEIQVSEISPAVPDPWGNVRLAATATAKISRKDFSLTWNKVLETGGLLVGDEILIDLDVQFIRPAK